MSVRYSGTTDEGAKVSLSDRSSRVDSRCWLVDRTTELRSRTGPEIVGAAVDQQDRAALDTAIRELQTAAQSLGSA
jgi:hypothetical protein